MMRSFAMSKYWFKSARRPIVVVTCAILLGSCSPIVQTRGNTPDPILLGQIEPGELSRDDIANMLGSPSSIATFGEETWYYISIQTETIAFFEPDILEQQVVAIAFDDSGMVASVSTYGLDDAQDIEPSTRVTPTGGRELTVLEQLFGNLGRFAGKQPAEGDR
jgi:outer membrane protein assembly factor BamE (lipoprotein component of BamABCDE complex)